MSAAPTKAQVTEAARRWAERLGVKFFPAAPRVQAASHYNAQAFVYDECGNRVVADTWMRDHRTCARAFAWAWERVPNIRDRQDALQVEDAICRSQDKAWTEPAAALVELDRVLLDIEKEN